MPYFGSLFFEPSFFERPVTSTRTHTAFEYGRRARERPRDRSLHRSLHVVGREGREPQETHARSREAPGAHRGPWWWLEQQSDSAR